MSPLYEVTQIRQVPGEMQRRWFTCESMDLVVWLGKDRKPTAFQLCYNKGRDERALTWRPYSGMTHSRVDDGEPGGMRYKSTPLLGPEPALPLATLMHSFAQMAQDIPPDVAEFVLLRLREMRAPALNRL